MRGRFAGAVKAGAAPADHLCMSDFRRHPADHLLTLDEVASIAKVDLSTVSSAIRDRRLRTESSRGQQYVRVGEVRRWLSRR